MHSRRKIGRITTGRVSLTAIEVGVPCLDFGVLLLAGGVEMLRGASDEVRSSRVSNGEGVGTYVVIILFVALI